MSVNNHEQLLSLSISGISQKKLETATPVRVSGISSTPLDYKTKSTIPISLLKEVFEYDADRGCLRWIKLALRSRATLGTRPGSPTKDGHIHIGMSVNGVRHYFFEHRAIWAMVYGYWPKEVDHINGDPQDSRLENLREVTHRENCLNGRTRARNSSGANGVNWDASRNKWLVRIQTENGAVNCGRFASFETAVAVRKAAEVQYGYHSNHGRN